MIDKVRCDDGFIWNRSICECKCDKSFYGWEYLDYKNCKYVKRFIDKLLNTTDTILISDKKVTYKNNYFIYIILLIIMCLIWLAIASTCCYYYYYKGYHFEKEYILSLDS